MINMKYPIKTFYLFMILLFLSSCATTNKKSLIGSLSDEKILVISGYPDTYYINVIGTTAFSNHNEKFDNLDLDVNKTILETFNSSEMKNKYEIYSGDFEFNFTKGNWYTGSGFNIKNSISELKKINTEFNSRYILLIGSERLYDSIFDTNQLYNGFGITKRYLMGQPTSVLYTTMKMALVDTQTFKIIKTVQSLQSEMTNYLKPEKIHKLEKNDFLIFKENYPSLFARSVQSLINKL